MMLALVSILAAAEAPAREYFGATQGVAALVTNPQWVVPAIDTQVFVGHRFSRWFSAEGLFIAHTGLSSWSDLGGGNPCSGTETHALRWQYFGLRYFVHMIHLPAMDVSFGNSFAVGLQSETLASTSAPLTTCWSPTRVRKSAGMSAGLLDLAWEIRPAHWWGIRLLFEAGVVLGENGGLPFESDLGVVFRF